MPSLLLLLIGFFGTAAIVVAAGIALARSADVIAARTSLGGLWMGSIFLAMATSLPELTTDISAIRLGAPDLAAGDLFGSSMANMLILAVVSLVPGSSLFRRAALDNTLTAALAIILTAMAAIVVLMRPSESLFGVGPSSAVILFVYLVGARAIYRHGTLLRQTGEIAEMSPPADVAAGERSSGEPAGLRRAVLTFGAGAAIILVVAPLLASSAKGLADATGLAQSFVGTWLVGLSTSLPELVTSLAAVRIGAYDMAVGNLFGSNAFNMLLFVPLDVAHRSGPILGAVHPVHAVTALVAVVLMAVGLAAIVYRAKGKLSMLEPSSGLILLGYLAGLAIIFGMSTAPA